MAGGRQAFYDIVNHREPTKVFIDLAGCPLSDLSPEAETALKARLGISDDGLEAREAILRALDTDARGVGAIVRPAKSLARRISPTAYIDERGMERHFTGLYWDIVTHPLEHATLDDLERYPWPDPDSLDERLLGEWVERARYYHEETDYAVCASHPTYGIFELGCWMCGFEEFMTRMALDEPFVRRFFEIILEYQKRVIARYYPPLAPYVDYTSSGDDFATQSGPFVSPGMFGELVAPYFKERIAFTKRYTDAKFLHHSCGYVTKLIPQLIDCGVEILNPIQPAGPGMAPAFLKAQFGDKLVFHGGLDTQSVLPSGDEKTVTEAVNALLDAMQPGGGYMFAAAHNLQADVPTDNIIAMFRAARAWRKA